MKFTFETRLFLLCTALLVVFQSLFFAFAEETTDEETPLNYACAQTMIDDGSALLDNYELFLNEYFLVDTPGSNQLEGAMDYYRYVEDGLNSIYSGALVIEGDSKTLEFASAEVTYCASIRDQYLRYAQVLLQKQLLSSANSKRTFEMVDGLKVMNDDLGDFSEQFLETFPGAFNQMNNALPCYARQCITK